MAEYPSWSDERDAYADASWSAAPAPPQYGGGGAYPGADKYGGGGGDPYASRAAPPAYGGYDNRGSAGYGGGSGGGGYGGGGGGYGGSSYAPPAGKPAGAAKASEISFDTSSRDPAHLRARVFIGCLGQSPVVREDIIELCRPFGPLMAVTLFKGYAFVQFEQAEDADTSCEVLNGKRWKGVNIDVHLAMEGLVRKTLPQKRGSESGGRGGSGMGGRAGRGGGAGGGSMGGGHGGGGRGGGGGFGGGGGDVNDYGQSAAKRPRPGLGSSMGEEALLDVNEQNKKAANADTTNAREMIGTEMADTLICGTCRYVSSDFIAFREHRKKQCVKPKESIEPPVLRCASCGLRFLTAWKMLFHLTDFHRMQLFKPDYSEESLERAKMEDDKYKNVSSTRMEAWRQEMMAEGAKAFVVESAAAGDAAAVPEEQRNGSQQQSQPAAAAPAEKSKSFANDDEVDTFGGGTTSGSGGDAAPKEVLTTGADYDEDEEDEDDAQPSTIPTLG